LEQHAAYGEEEEVFRDHIGTLEGIAGLAGHMNEDWGGGKLNKVRAWKIE
jgi:hypothetical protein